MPGQRGEDEAGKQQTDRAKNRRAKEPQHTR
jgi:hypothetical protein